MNKYKATPMIINGIRFASKKEARRYKELLLLENAGIIANIEVQPVFDLHVNDHKVCKYIADFRYDRFIEVDKPVSIVEDVKGMKSGAAWQMFRLKQKLMKAVHNIDVEVI